jgi:sialate O-acetylesterase
MKPFVPFLGILLAATLPAPAAVRLPRIFTDHMVVQQGQPIAVWGSADPGQMVAVKLDQTGTVTRAATDGSWRVRLPAMKADLTPHTLTVTGGNAVTFQDVMVGEVWLVGGQSNMNRTINVTEFNDPQLRMFWIGYNTTPNDTDLNEGVAGWTPSTAQDLAKAAPSLEGRDKGKPRTAFSEVGYVFAKQLREQLKVPVGVIQATVGGSTADAWTPKPELFPGRHPWGKQIEPVPYMAHMPGLLYHCMIDGMVPYSMRGVIWYQGEDDGRNKNYEADLTTLIASYRKLWNNADLAFHMVQIAQTTYASGMLGVYEAQVAVSEKLDQCGLAPSNTLQDHTMKADEGNKERNIPGTGWPLVGTSNPHPPNKHIVAKRLADIALKQTYGVLEREVLGPTFLSQKVDGNKLIVTFKHAGSRLVADDAKELVWFELSDGTKTDERDNSPLVYHKATARITGEVTSDAVAMPKFVRFAWHPLARHNLANKEGLPALPFRSDALPQMWNRR